MASFLWSNSMYTDSDLCGFLIHTMHAHMYKWTGSVFAQVMACRSFEIDAKPFIEQMMVYC